MGRADGRPANALHCNRPLEYAGFYLSKKSGAVHKKKRALQTMRLQVQTLGQKESYSLGNLKEEGG